MVNVRDKGKRFELWLCKQIAEKFGIECRRTPNSGGLSVKGDLIGLSGTPARYHWEAKHQETAKIWQWLEQAQSDCGDKIPVVVFKRNRSEPMACLRLSDFLNALKGGTDE